MSPRLLLDTHTLLWALSEPDRLSAAVRDALADESAGVFVSAASAWEIATKYRLGKLPGASVVLADFDSHLRRLGATPLALSSTHGLLAGQMEWSHRDPFDRMLAVQALVEGLLLASADRAFSELPGLRVLW